MEFYIVSGDTVMWLPAFSPAIITPVPGTIPGSATKTMVTNKPMCLEGDEKKVVVSGVMYISGAFVIPGTGTLTIEKLNADQLSTKTTVEGKKPILQGTFFDAKFTVVAPAMQPPAPPKPPVPDPVKTYMGKGNFIPTNFTVTDPS